MISVTYLVFTILHKLELQIKDVALKRTARKLEGKNECGTKNRGKT